MTKQLGAFDQSGIERALDSQGIFAKSILGDKFIMPEDVTQKFGWQYTQNELTALYESVNDPDILRWLELNTFVFMPRPPKDMDMHAVLHLFSPASDGQSITFSERTFLSGGGWLAIRYGAGRDTRFLKKPPTERMLSAPEVVYGATVCYVLRTLNLVGGDQVMTSTLCRNGSRVHVAYPEAKYFRLTGLWADDRWDYQGGFSH